jgi:hypothetical protein
MTAHGLLEYLARCNVVLIPDGAMLRYSAPRGVLTTALRQEILRRKGEILAILSVTPSVIPSALSHAAFSAKAEIAWPAECLECEQRIGQKHARLFPLLGRPVDTPIGTGILEQVFQSRAAVLINDHLKFVHPDYVRPTDGRREPNSKGGGG